MLTVRQVNKRVREINVLDDEKAHGQEDLIWRDVLLEIGSGVHDQKTAAALARAALKTLSFDFARWCA